MKAIYEKFEDLFARRNELEMTVSEIDDFCTSLTNEIVYENDDSILNVKFLFSSHGTWKSVCFVSDWYFGEKLSETIRKTFGGIITHTENDKVIIENYNYKLYDNIFELFY